MKIIGIILSILIWLSIFIGAMIIVSYGYDKTLWHENRTIGIICNVIFGLYLGAECYIYSEKFYKWFNSNLKK